MACVTTIGFGAPPSSSSDAGTTTSSFATPSAQLANATPVVLQVRKKRTNAEVAGTVAKQAEAAAASGADKDPQPVKKKTKRQHAVWEGRVAQRRLRRFEIIIKFCD